MSTRNMCEAPGCDRPAEMKESGLCKRCYAHLHYWVNRSVTDKMKHRKKLKFWAARSEMLVQKKQ